MGDKRTIREKIVDLFRDATDGAIEPRKIVVLPKRSSGPREAPSDWWEYDKQAAVAPQCNVCHERALPGMPPLIRGLCATCRARISDEPPAAA